MRQSGRAYTAPSEVLAVLLSMPDATEFVRRSDRRAAAGAAPEAAIAGAAAAMRPATRPSTRPRPDDLLALPDMGVFCADNFVRRSTRRAAPVMPFAVAAAAPAAAIMVDSPPVWARAACQQPAEPRPVAANHPRTAKKTKPAAEDAVEEAPAAEQLTDGEAATASMLTGPSNPLDLEFLKSLEDPGALYCDDHFVRRSVRRSGGDPMQLRVVHELVQKLQISDTSVPKVLRLKDFLSADAGPAQIDAVLDALLTNTWVEALYIQNFENGMRDDQMKKLQEVLMRGRIWAVNVGENFSVTRAQWESFASCLPLTNVGYMYASEHILMGTNLKERMRDAIRVNRSRKDVVKNPDALCLINNMWWNPPKDITRCAAPIELCCRRCRCDRCKWLKGNGLDIWAVRRSRSKLQRRRRYSFG